MPFDHCRWTAPGIVPPRAVRQRAHLARVTALEQVERPVAGHRATLDLGPAAALAGSQAQRQADLTAVPDRIDEGRELTGFGALGAQHAKGLTEAFGCLATEQRRSGGVQVTDARRRAAPAAVRDHDDRRPDQIRDLRQQVRERLS